MNRRKTKETGLVDEDGNPIELSDVEKEGDGGVGDEGLVAARVEEPTAEVKAEVTDTTPTSETPKGKRATKAKGEKVSDIQVEEVKPEVEEAVVNDDLPPAIAVEQVQADADALVKPAPKKRGRKSKDVVATA